jgi:hypothetical protein
VRLKTAPSIPHSLLPEMIAEEKQTEKNNSRPTQDSAVRTADELKVLLPGLVAENR